MNEPRIGGLVTYPSCGGPNANTPLRVFADYGPRRTRKFTRSLNATIRNPSESCDIESRSLGKHHLNHHIVSAPFSHPSRNDGPTLQWATHRRRSRFRNRFQSLPSIWSPQGHDLHVYQGRLIESLHRSLTLLLCGISKPSYDAWVQGLLSAYLSCVLLFSSPWAGDRVVCRARLGPAPSNVGLYQSIIRVRIDPRGYRKGDS